MGFIATGIGMYVMINRTHLIGRCGGPVEGSNKMTPWAKVVTDPLGLAGFALFAVFVYLAKVKRNGKRRWLSPFAFAMAAVALIGGLVLAYLKVRVPGAATPPVRTAQPAALTQQQTNQQVQQTSSGAGSPNVQGVQGNVTITVDQGTGKTETKTPQRKNRTK
jgi:hypothetical protein